MIAPSKQTKESNIPAKNVFYIDIEKDIKWFPEPIEVQNNVMVYAAKNIKINKEFNLTDVYEVKTNITFKSLIKRVIYSDLKTNVLDLENLTYLQTEFYKMYLYEWVLFVFFFELLKENGLLIACGEQFQKMSTPEYYNAYMSCRMFVVDLFEHNWSTTLKNAYLDFKNPFIEFWKYCNRNEELDYNIFIDDVKSIESLIEITEEFATPEDKKTILTKKVKEFEQYKDLPLISYVSEDTTIFSLLDSTYNYNIMENLSLAEIERAKKTNINFAELANIYLLSKKVSK